MKIQWVSMTRPYFTGGRPGPIRALVIHATAGTNSLPWLRQGGSSGAPVYGVEMLKHTHSWYNKSTPRCANSRGIGHNLYRRYDMSSVPDLKMCGKCRATQPVSEFYRSTKADDGLQWWCKSCFRAAKGAKPRRQTQGWIKNGVGYIPLFSGQVAIVDPDMVAMFKGNWSLSAQGYPQSFVDGRMNLMHRVITGRVSDRTIVVDHINGNKLDNRRANLRIATRGENAVNVQKHAANNKSGYRGVYWYTQRQCWRASFTWQHKTYHKCGFTTAEAAARAYDALVREHGPPLVFLNFPEETE
jgi:hypothetical protein